MSAQILQQQPIPALDAQLAKEILGVLHEQYPGWCWSVDAFPHQNIVVVRNADLGLGFKSWGFVLHKTKLGSWRDIKNSVVLAGGELLERYNVWRGKYDEDKARDKNLMFAAPEI